MTHASAIVNELTSELSSRLSSYLLGLGAATLASASAAHGAVIGVDYAPDVVLNRANGVGELLNYVSIEIDALNAGPEFRIQHVWSYGQPANPFAFVQLFDFSPTSKRAVVNALVPATQYAAVLGFGTSIGPSTPNFAIPTPTNHYGNLAYRHPTLNPLGTGTFLGVNDGYVGMRYEITPGNFLYGWARIGVASWDGSGNVLQITMKSWAFETTPNTAILADESVIPEPTSLGMMALGAIGVLARRQRRQA